MLTRPLKFALSALVAALFLALPLRALTVGAIHVEQASGSTVIRVATSALSHPRLEVLSGRILVVVPGGKHSLKSLALSSGPVERVRFGRSAKDLRMVLDLRAKVSAKIAKITAKGFDIVLSPRAAQNAAATPLSATAATKAAAVSPGGLAALSPARVGYTYRVVDLSLGGDEAHSELVISADGPANYASSVRDGGKLLRLDFRDCSLAWSGDATALKDSAIVAVSVRSMQMDGESRVRVELHLSGALNYAFKRDQNQLVVRLDRPAKVAVVPATGDLETPVSLDVQDADLVGVLKTLCEQAGFSYQFTRTLLTKTPPDSLVTMKAENRPFHEVLDTLLTQVQCREVRLGNTVYMGTATEITTRRDSLPVITRTYAPKYLTIKQALTYLAEHYSYDTDELARIRHITLDPRDPSRLLLVGSPDEVSLWASYLQQADVPESGDDEGEGGGGQARTQVFHLDYLDNSNSSLIDGAIAQLYPDGEQAPSPLIDASTRTLVVTTTPRYLHKIELLLAKLDVSPMQVNIEGKIVEVDQSAVSQIGINWSAIASGGSPGSVAGGTAAGALPPAGTGSLNAGVASAFASNFTLGTVVNAFNISQITAQINALVQDQKAQIVTAPNITTIDNQSATLGLIQTQVYEQQTSTITNGVAVNTFTFPTSSLPLTLVVTPKVSREDRRVLMNINFQLTSPNGQPIQTGAPVPTEQEEAITNVSVNSGDTYVIGGLVTQDNNQNVYRVPFLSDIPLLGLLFKYTSISKVKKDIIVFIKPTIVSN